MKKIFLAFALIAALFSFFPALALAQEEDSGVFLSKVVTQQPDENGLYYITLEAYATGQTVKSESTIVPPVNVILLIDTSKAMHTNQQPEDLSNAVKTFIESFPAPTDPAKSHNITVITFDNAVRDVWQKVSVSQAETIRAAIMNYGTSGSLFSQPEYALERAIAEAQTFKNDPQASANQTMVLFFTSATRDESGDLSWYAQSSISTVNLAYILKHDGTLPEGHTSVGMYSNRIHKKDEGGTLVKTLTYTEGLNCKVFSIANFKKTKSATNGEENNVKHLLNFVSSLYPNKWVASDSEFNTTSGDGTEEPNTTNYHQYSPDPAQIGEMFKTVQEEIVTPEIPIDETSIVRDILTPDFQLPEGVSLNDAVKIYTAECIYSSYPNFSFSTTLTPLSDATISLGSDGRTINVSNFNFADHYCGYDDVQKVKTPHDGGLKLVIQIPIEPVADYQGGYNLPTNEKGSGIYTADSDNPLQAFDVPTLDFPSIGIIKNGLAKGESATFTVQRIKDHLGNTLTTPDTPFNIILTGNASGGVVYAILKNIPEGTYQVTESNWSWTYDVTAVTIKDGTAVKDLDPSAPATTQVLAESQTTDWPSGIKETVKCVLFNFTNEKNSAYDSADEHSIYSEAVVKNTFTGGSVVKVESKTTQSKTTQSKE